MNRAQSTGLVLIVFFAAGLAMAVASIEPFSPPLAISGGLICLAFGAAVARSIR